jgi:hypothetical protein
MILKYMGNRSSAGEKSGGGFRFPESVAHLPVTGSAVNADSLSYGKAAHHFLQIVRDTQYKIADFMVALSAVRYLGNHWLFLFSANV